MNGAKPMFHEFSFSLHFLSNYLCSPQTPKELFNHHHTCLCNIVKHIFGVIKCQWHILQLPPEYSMEVQACIPAALCALHNFICRSDTAVFDIDDDYEVFGGDGGDVGELAEGPADKAEWQRTEQCQEAITAEMWEPVPGQQ
jgi:hypothetical protein